MKMVFIPFWEQQKSAFALFLLLMKKGYKYIGGI